MDQEVYPSCKTLLPQNAFFCPNCGKEIRKAPLSTAIGKQLSIYALSIFLPPLGLWPGIKYLLQKDKKANIIGLVAILLTILSTVVTIWFANNFISQFISQTTNYQNLGF